MTDTSNTKFNRIIDKHGNTITQCFFDKNPENILALMVENISNNFEEPLYLQKSLVVSIPDPDDKNMTEISIWFSANEDKDVMASIIQSFFEWRFPNLEINDKTKMGMDSFGKLNVQNFSE